MKKLVLMVVFVVFAGVTTFTANKSSAGTGTTKPPCDGTTVAEEGKCANKGFVQPTEIESQSCQSGLFELPYTECKQAIAFAIGNFECNEPPETGDLLSLCDKDTTTGQVTCYLYRQCDAVYIQLLVNNEPRTFFYCVQDGDTIVGKDYFRITKDCEPVRR